MPPSLTPFRARAVALLLCSALTLVTACEESTSCTLIGCGSSRFTLAKDAWAPGEYEVEVSYSLGGDVSFLCSFEVGEDGSPNGSGAPDAEPLPECEQRTGSTRSVHLQLGEDVVLEMYDEPDSFQLAVRSAGQTIFEDSIAPSYVVSWPNGEDCGDCRSAVQSIELD